MNIEIELKNLILSEYRSVRAFSETAGIPYSTIDSIFKRGISNSSVANILKICQVLNIDADALGDGKIEKKSAFASSTDFSIPGLLPLPKTTKRPLIGTIACGEPVLAEENIEGQVDVPEHIRCDFVLRCKGDSMIGARIQDGDLVYIHQQPEVEPGEIAAVLLDGTEATLKRFYRSGDTITLVAENPAYAPIVVTKDRQFRILGKAVGFTSLIR